MKKQDPPGSDDENNPSSSIGAVRFNRRLLLISMTAASAARVATYATPMVAIATPAHALSLGQILDLLDLLIRIRNENTRTRALLDLIPQVFTLSQPVLDRIEAAKNESSLANAAINTAIGALTGLPPNTVQDIRDAIDTLVPPLDVGIDAWQAGNDNLDDAIQGVLGEPVGAALESVSTAIINVGDKTIEIGEDLENTSPLLAPIGEVTKLSGLAVKGVGVAVDFVASLWPF